MRKFFLLLCLFLMCGCASNKIQVERVEDGYHLEQIASDLPMLYGGGYRYVKTEDGFEVESIRGDGSNLNLFELYKKNNIVIRFKENSDYTRDYIYDDGTKTILLFSGKGEGPEYNIYPPYPGVFENDNIIYFFYYDENNLTVNEVIDGELKNPKYYPLVDGEYTYDGFAYNSYEHYPVYRSKDHTKYICEEREYIFDSSDRVIFMNDYIFYSTFELAKPTGTYILNRKTNEKVQLNENIDLILDPLYKDLPNIYNSKINGNSILFMESVDNQSYYTYGQFVDNTFKMVRIPYVYRETDSISLYDENTILFIKDDENHDLDFFAITIK